MKHLLVTRRECKKSTKVHKEGRPLKAKQLGSYEEGKTVLQRVLLCFIVILADNRGESMSHRCGRSKLRFDVKNPVELGKEYDAEIEDLCRRGDSA